MTPYSYLLRTATNGVLRSNSTKAEVPGVMHWQPFRFKSSPLPEPAEKNACKVLEEVMGKTRDKLSKRGSC
jgi:hypothetical protein